MNQRPKKRRGPIGWLVDAFRDDPIHATLLTGFFFVVLGMLWMVLAERFIRI